MRYPKFLKEHGSIGFIAPSFGCTQEPYGTLFSSALERFHNLGYETVCGPNVYIDKGIGKSNTPKLCADEINDFFTNDLCDVLISCGGGETMCEDLPYVDFDRISDSEPRWFMGYSDNSNLVFTLPLLCDTAAIYGPNAPSFGTKPLHPSLNDALEVLKGKNLKVHNYERWEISGDESGDDIYAPYNCTEKFSMELFCGTKKTDKELKLSGRLLGGCLDSLITLCGTRFDKVKEFNRRYKNDGTLWFFEACDLNPMQIRRALWQLRQAGWFDTATGFLVGRPLHFSDDYMGVNRHNAVVDMLGDMNLPLLFDLDIGHLPPMMPIINGAVAKAKACENHFEMQMYTE